MGIEPTALAWKAKVLPLYDTRSIKSEIQNSKFETISLKFKKFGQGYDASMEVGLRNK